MKVWDIISEIVNFLGAPMPFNFILNIVLSFWFVFLIFLFLFFPIFLLLRLLKGRKW